MDSFQRPRIGQNYENYYVVAEVPKPPLKRRGKVGPQNAHQSKETNATRATLRATKSPQLKDRKMRMRLPAGSGRKRRCGPMDSLLKRPCRRPHLASEPLRGQPRSDDEHQVNGTHSAAEVPASLAGS